MKRFKRWRVFAEPKLQTMLCVRVAFYWLVCLITSRIALWASALLRDVIHPTWLTENSPTVLFMTLVVLPVVLVDTLIFSNRFAGPMRRLRKHMEQVAEGGQATSVQFRKGDYYRELEQAWNRIVVKLNESNPQNTLSHEGGTKENSAPAEANLAEQGAP